MRGRADSLVRFPGPSVFRESLSFRYEPGRACVLIAGLKPDGTIMKNLCAIAFAAISALGTATVHAAPDSTAVFATWHMADLHDVTQAWYFTGEALSGQYRDGAPWAGKRPLVQPADAALAAAPLEPPGLPFLHALPILPDPPAVPARVDVPPTIPEPRMAPMLLLGLLLLFLRISRKEDLFG